MNEFSLNIYSNKAEELRQETEATFEHLNLATDVLPATMQPDDGAIKLVFVGQYSAGKSSIIKMISGIETEIGAGITTQESHVYKWNDLEIIDTPGIQTGLRADHDEITYDQISKAHCWFLWLPMKALTVIWESIFASWPLTRSEAAIWC